jgi:hypothetical protein
MADPLDLDTILAEFSEDDPAWVLCDTASGKYVTIPDARYPGRNIFRFFMSELDAKRILEALFSRRLRSGDVRSKQSK